jgi:hypothetical protein
VHNVYRFMYLYICKLRINLISQYFPPSWEIWVIPTFLPTLPVGQVIHDKEILIDMKTFWLVATQCATANQYHCFFKEKISVQIKMITSEKRFTITYRLSMRKIKQSNTLARHFSLLKLLFICIFHRIAVFCSFVLLYSSWYKCKFRNCGLSHRYLSNFNILLIIYVRVCYKHEKR